MLLRSMEFGDEEHFIYVDSSKDDGGELGRLMHDFRAKEAKEMQAEPWPTACTN